MSEEQMSDSTFGRLFIIMIISMSVFTAIIMVLASMAAGDVNARLDERSEIENSNSIISRIAPVGQFSAESTAIQTAVAEVVVLTGEEAYTSCAACHDAGIAGAPMVGDINAWSARLEQDVDTLYEHAINGYQGSSGVMPAKGGNIALSDESVKAAVEYMVGKSR